MAAFTRELFLQTLDEWGRYPGAFARLDASDQVAFLKAQGYASLRDLLTHVAAWWEEGRGVIAEALKHPDKPGPKYDLDAFNAAALERFKGMSAAEFTAWYESERQHTIALVTSLTADQLAVRRVQGWLDAVLLEHLKEHGFDAPRFLVEDILQREWGDYVAGFSGMTAEQQAALLQKQGFARFQDLLAHILAWWERGIGALQSGSTADPQEVEDVDAFNALAVKRFQDLPESQVVSQFDETRLMLASLVDMLPDEIIARPNIQDWLRSDVLDHYYEHAL
ncbi:MAG TPA: hypothetical protein VFH29_03810 [Anaerolineales bacterium]|nr:hypothetical protein [Anaerolineales bacterium]